MSVYDHDLDKNPANYQPLTPLSFLARSAAVYPSKWRSFMGAQRTNYAQFLCPLPPAWLGTGEGRHQEGRHGFGAAGQYAGHARMPLWRADDGRRAEHAQHQARCRDHCLFAGPCGGEDTHRRQGILEAGERCAGADAGSRIRSSSTMSIRNSRSMASRVGSIDYEQFVAQRRSRFRLAVARRRVGGDLAQLYIRHHRQSQGRRLSSSRRLSAGAGQCADRRHAEACGLSVDAADVPLQRLVFPVVAVGDRRHACDACAGCARS